MSVGGFIGNPGGNSNSSTYDDCVIQYHRIPKELYSLNSLRSKTCISSEELSHGLSLAITGGAQWFVREHEVVLLPYSLWGFV